MSSSRRVLDLYKPLLAEPVSDWERWFAWRPVHEWNHGVVWLRPVYRRRCRPYEHLTGAKRVWQQYAVRRADAAQQLSPAGSRGRPRRRHQARHQAPA